MIKKDLKKEEDFLYTYECMSSKGFGQVGHKNKRGFQIPNTFFEFVRQPLMSN
jgi:hypothetical protein